MNDHTIILDAIGYVAGAYVVLTYLADKLFPRTEIVSSNDPRYINR